MREARSAGRNVVASATRYTARKITPRLAHGTSKLRFSQLGVLCESRITFQATISPGSVPTAIALSPTNEDRERRLLRRYDAHLDAHRAAVAEVGAGQKRELVKRQRPRHAGGKGEDD